MSDLPYHELPPPPASVSGVTVLCRLADGLAFRYRWATEDLRPADLAFTPCAGAMSLGKLLAHMRILVEWVDGTLRGALAHEPADIDDPAPPRGDELEELRQGTLAAIVSLRAALLELGDERLAGVTIGRAAQGPAAVLVAAQRAARGLPDARRAGQLVAPDGGQPAAARGRVSRARTAVGAQRVTPRR
jgi:hypothetical protein